MTKREEGGREIELKMVIEEGSIKSGTSGIVPPNWRAHSVRDHLLYFPPTGAHILCVPI